MAAAANAGQNAFSGLNASVFRGDLPSRTEPETNQQTQKEKQPVTTFKSNPFARLHQSVQKKHALQPTILAFEAPNRDFEWYQKALRTDFIPQPSFGRAGDHWTSNAYYLRIDSVTGLRLPEEIIQAGIQLSDVKWRLQISLFSLRHASFFGKTVKSPLFDVAYVPQYAVGDELEFSTDGGQTRVASSTASQQTQTQPASIAMNPIQVPVGASTAASADLAQKRPPFAACMPAMGFYYHSTIHDPYCMGIAEVVVVVDNPLAPPKEFAIGWTMMNLFPNDTRPSTAPGTNSAVDGLGPTGLLDVSSPSIAAQLKEPVNPAPGFDSSQEPAVSSGSSPQHLLMSAPINTLPFFKGSPRALAVLAECAAIGTQSLGSHGASSSAIPGFSSGAASTAADAVLSPATLSALASRLQRADDLALTYRLFGCSDLRQIQHLFRANELIPAGQGYKIPGFNQPIPRPLHLRNAISTLSSFSLKLRSPVITLPLEFEPRMLATLHFLRASYHTPPNIIETPEISSRLLRVAVHNSKRVVTTPVELPLVPMTAGEYLEHMNSPSGGSHLNPTAFSLLDLPFGTPPASIAQGLTFRGEVDIANSILLDALDDPSVALVAELVYVVAWRPWQGSSSSSYLETLVHKASTRADDVAAAAAAALTSKVKGQPSAPELTGMEYDRQAQPNDTASGFPVTTIVAAIGIRSFETEASVVNEKKLKGEDSEDITLDDVLRRPVALDGSPQQILMLRGPGRSLLTPRTPLFGYSTAFEAIHPAVHRDFVLTVELISPQAPSRLQPRVTYQKKNRSIESCPDSSNLIKSMPLQTRGVSIADSLLQSPEQTRSPSKDSSTSADSSPMSYPPIDQVEVDATRAETDPFTRALEVHMQPDLFVHVNPNIGESRCRSGQRVKHVSTLSIALPSDMSKDEIKRRLARLMGKTLHPSSSTILSAPVVKSRTRTRTSTVSVDGAQQEEYAQALAAAAKVAASLRQQVDLTKDVDELESEAAKAEALAKEDEQKSISMIDDVIRKMLCDNLTATRKLAPTAASFVYLEMFFQNPFPRESVFVVCIDDPLMKDVVHQTQAPARPSLKPLRDVTAAARLRASAMAAGMKFSTDVGVRLPGEVGGVSESSDGNKLPPLVLVEEVATSVLGGAVDAESTRAYSFRAREFELIAIPLGFECPSSMPPSPYLSEVTVRRTDDGALIYFPKSREINVYVTTVECESLARLRLQVDLPPGVAEAYQRTQKPDQSEK